MKLIIDIPESEYQTYLVAHISGMGNSAMERIIDGKSLKDELQEIRQEIDSHCSDNRDRNDGLYIAMKIIDKYKAESEDKE